MKIIIILRSYKILITLGICSIVFGIAFNEYFSFEIVIKKIDSIVIFVEQFRLIALLVYLCIYLLAVMFSLPVASILTIFSGYLFGALVGGFVALIAAVLGASILFLIVRAGLRPTVVTKLKSNPLFDDIKGGILKNQFRYLLLLRFMPIFPFWVVNLVPAVLGVRFKVFISATFFVIFPGTFIIAGIGQKLRLVSEPSLDFVNELSSDPQFILLFFTLSFITILPIFWRWFRFKNNRASRLS